VGKTLTNLASVFGALGDVLKQRELLESSLVIKEQHYGKDNASVSTTLLQLGIACGDLGDQEHEMAHFGRCLAIREASFGKETFQVAAILSAIAKGKLKLKDYSGARELAAKALAIQERHFGKDTDEVASTLSTLGCALLGLNLLEEGKACVRRALVAFREIYAGKDHPSVTFCSNLLSELEGPKILDQWVAVTDPDKVKNGKSFLFLLTNCQETG